MNWIPIKIEVKAKLATIYGDTSDPDPDNWEIKDFNERYEAQVVAGTDAIKRFDSKIGLSDESYVGLIHMVYGAVIDAMTRAKPEIDEEWRKSAGAQLIKK